MDYSQFKQLEFRRKFWKIAGAEIYINEAAGNQEVGYIRMKAWKLREDIRIFTNRDMQQELVQIHARQIIDFGATYDVTNSSTGQPIASLRRKGLKSTFVRDFWNIMDDSDNVIGTIQETSSILAIARRWLEILPYGDFIGLIFAFVPQTYVISMNQTDGSSAQVAALTHRKNPFIVKMSLDTSMAQVAVDPQLILSSTALLSIIDAAKNN